MEATLNQTAVKDITMVAISAIRPNSFNPRKHFDETSLNELAESIRQQGILQPVTVRPIADSNDYELVFGERRYRAATIVGMQEIPAIINDLSDEEAEEIAITENLQRKDVTPMEEANAYQRLMESGRHDLSSLAVQFGKSEAYIRTRLKFASLIPEIAALLETDEITVSVASEICRYGEDIQREVYEQHLKEDVTYSSWRGQKASEIARSIERQYTADLDRYSFDKTLCLSCPHNTNNMSLFCEGCGKCANRTCLAEMNASYLVEKTLQVLAENPTATLGHTDYDYNLTAVERLMAMGHEVESAMPYGTAYPRQPEAPEKEDYDNEEAYEAACSDYEQEQSDYRERCAEIHRQSENGEISLYVKIGSNNITLCYVKKNNTADDTTQGQPLSPVEKLEKQDKRNKEIALEKTIEDTKKQILNIDVAEAKFGADEDRMVYFFLLSSLRRENFALLGISEEHSPYLNDEDKMNIIANLTAKTKAVIRRDYLIAQFKDAYRNNATADLMLDFARKHMPNELAEIEDGYNQIYEKRHQRIEERKAAIVAKEKPTDENDDAAEASSEDAKPEEAAA